MRQLLGIVSTNADDQCRSGGDVGFEVVYDLLERVAVKLQKLLRGFIVEDIRDGPGRRVAFLSLSLEQLERFDDEPRVRPEEWHAGLHAARLCRRCRRLTTRKPGKTFL